MACRVASDVLILFGVLCIVFTTFALIQESTISLKNTEENIAKKI